MTEPVARAAQRELADQGCRDAAGCLDADTLMAFAEGRLDGSVRDAVAARVAACARCAAALRVVLDAADWATDLAADLARCRQADDGAGRPAMSRSRRRAWLPLAVAASVALMVASSLLLQRPPVPESLRGQPVVATTPPDGALLVRAPGRLAWPCERAPAATQVELLGSDATLRWSGSAVDCAAIVPAETRDSLAAGGYLWRVKNAAGDVVLGPIAFRITR